MRAGDLRHEITIQANTPTQDSLGGASDSWVDVATGIRAKVTDDASRETFNAAQDRAETVREFRFRVCEAGEVTTAHRIVFESANHDIVSVNKVDRRRVYVVRGISR